MSTPSSDRAAATQIIDAVLEAGWNLLHVNDGEEVIKVKTRNEALEAVFAVDMAHVFFQHTRNHVVGWVWFVLGNDPEEVAADYTVNLSDSIDPVTDKWWDR